MLPISLSHNVFTSDIRVFRDKSKHIKLVMMIVLMAKNDIIQFGAVKLPKLSELSQQCSSAGSSAVKKPHDINQKKEIGFH